jgi:hypothetical protein
MEDGMRKLILTLGVMAAVVNAGNGKNYVVAIEDNVGIYEHQTRKLFETPIFTVGKTDRLLVVGNEKGKIEVRSAAGKTGWVDKNRMRSASSRAFFFDDASVIGYFDNPTPVYIFDGTESDTDPLRLERSFRDCLSQNVDRETADRLTK